MEIANEYRALAGQIAAATALPAVRGLYFPRLEADGFRDEFGFVLLDSGDIGAFYVSLDDTLPELWKHYPQPSAVHLPLTSLLDKLSSHSLAERALGFGAFNALSQYVLRRSGFQASQRRHKTNTHTETLALGMVGYFCPLVERITARGREVVVLEKKPERVDPHPLVRVVTTPEELAGCGEVLCTASTLINDTLDGILAACRDVDSFSLIGPTASGLPDILFARGIDSVGAIRFTDQQLLLETLSNEESWGKAGEKYEINREDYPGVAQLLERLPPVHS